MQPAKRCATNHNCTITSWLLQTHACCPPVRNQCTACGISYAVCDVTPAVVFMLAHVYNDLCLSLLLRILAQRYTYIVADTVSDPNRCRASTMTDTHRLPMQIVAEMRLPEWRDALAAEFTLSFKDEGCTDWETYCNKQASGRTWGSTMELRVAQVLYRFKAKLYEEHLLVSCRC